MNTLIGFEHRCAQACTLDDRYIISENIRRSSVPSVLATSLATDHMAQYFLLSRCLRHPFQWNKSAWAPEPSSSQSQSFSVPQNGSKHTTSPSKWRSGQSEAPSLWAFPNERKILRSADASHSGPTPSNRAEVNKHAPPLIANIWCSRLNAGSTSLLLNSYNAHLQIHSVMLSQGRTNNIGCC